MFVRVRIDECGRVVTDAKSPLMTNITTLLKQEIVRVARKEVRGETQHLKKASAAHRSHIAALKRQVLQLQQQLRRVSRSSSWGAPAASADQPVKKIRYSAKSLAAQRRRLGLSASALGALLGVSSLSIYHWESGNTRPRSAHLPDIAALKNMGKADAAALLAALRS
jgi:DNA-binding transcriptional regulator YiaG